MLRAGGQSRPWWISQHLLGCESDQTRHHHAALPSQGRVCPLQTCTSVCLQGKGATAQFCALLCHSKVCSSTLCPKEQTCSCLPLLQIQGLVWEWRRPWPSALLRHEKLGLFSALSHMEMVLCSSCLGKVKQSQLCMCEQHLSNESKELSYQSLFSMDLTWPSVIRALLQSRMCLSPTWIEMPESAH